MSVYSQLVQQPDAYMCNDRLQTSSAAVTKMKNKLVINNVKYSIVLDIPWEVTDILNLRICIMQKSAFRVFNHVKMLFTLAEWFKASCSISE